jgi:hypothetical protein
MNSSDCVAKENECSDSDGNLERSSPNAKAGDPGGEVAESEGCLDTGGLPRLSEAARWVEGGGREPGCCLMRRRPDAPIPCSCSGTRGDLGHVSHCSSSSDIYPLVSNNSTPQDSTTSTLPTHAHALTSPSDPTALHQRSASSPCLLAAAPSVPADCSCSCS